MGVIIGVTPWWQASIARSSPVGTTLPDGSKIICKAGGTAWIIAPACTQVFCTWGNYVCCGFIDTPPVGISTHPQITTTNFPVLFNQLVSCGFNPSDWFVPSREQALNPLIACVSQWDAGIGPYWTSTECTCCVAVDMRPLNGCVIGNNKDNRFLTIRAIRCVTY